MFKRLAYLFLLLSIVLSAGCGVGNWVSSKTMNPEDIFQKAQTTMQELESMRLDGSTILKGNLLGSSFEYRMQTVSQSKLEKGIPVETHMETTMAGDGLREMSEAIYFSDTQFGTYNSSTSSWEIADFHAEDQFFMQLFISSLDPAGSLNKYANSNIDQELEVIGKEKVNGISCIGISVKTDPDEMIKEMSPILTALAGKSANIASSLASGMVKELEQEYWIGEKDNLVHGMNMKLTTPFGDYHSEVTVYDHNEPFELPY